LKSKIDISSVKKNFSSLFLEIFSLWGLPRYILIGALWFAAFAFEDNEKLWYKKTTRPLARRIGSNNLLESFAQKGATSTDNDCKVRPFEVDFQIIFYVVQHKRQKNDEKTALLQSFSGRIQL